MSQNIGMSSCCLSGKVHEGKQAGREDQIGGLETYISEPQNGSKEKSIIFIVDSTLIPSIAFPIEMTNGTQSLATNSPIFASWPMNTPKPASTPTSQTSTRAIHLTYLS